MKCVVKLPLNIVSLEVFESFLCQKCNCNRVKPEVVSYIRTQSGCRNLFSNELCDYMMKNHSISVIDNELAFSGEYCLSVNPVVPSSIQLLIESDIMRLSEAQQFGNSNLVRQHLLLLRKFFHGIFGIFGGVCWGLRSN